jgi:hypothetical protein
MLAAIPLLGNPEYLAPSVDMFNNYSAPSQRFIEPTLGIR